LRERQAAADIAEIVRQQIFIKRVRVDIVAEHPQVKNQTLCRIATTIPMPATSVISAADDFRVGTAGWPDPPGAVAVVPGMMNVPDPDPESEQIAVASTVSPGFRESG
jgi:hypothetical protein